MFKICSREREAREPPNNSTEMKFEYPGTNSAWTARKENPKNSNLHIFKENWTELNWIDYFYTTFHQVKDLISKRFTI